MCQETIACKSSVSDVSYRDCALDRLLPAGQASAAGARGRGDRTGETGNVSRDAANPMSSDLPGLARLSIRRV
jgi:hypothetical protein